MKKIIFKTIAVIAVMLAVTSCVENNCETLTPEQIAENWENTSGRINHKEANELEENYVRFLYQGSRDSLLTESGEVYQDTREVWFDIEELKNYINYVEQYGKDKKYDNLGIRVYLGSKAPQKNGKAQTTVFFYGTGRFAGVKKLQGDDGGAIVEPNLPGADGLNKGNSGMPPNGLQYP
ncbi:hypothetical protein A9Q93_04160 [Nonlabens dokdonensis]|uniref:Lipoprotein n=1 Tax=Nonlabens dokdonensis TaxID=328515 RepID=A0A1Z8B698_9FLAO|nr:hypothetical protein [Nonlabens dokdonensis]OUS18095.1 hypothetical protein A9Q93_04160 [Nonlabens dokdonensis]